MGTHVKMSVGILIFKLLFGFSVGSVFGLAAIL